MRHRSKFVTQLIFGAGLFLLPLSVDAACSSVGYSIIYINGIRTSEADAVVEKTRLSNLVGDSFNSEPVAVYLGYNESHGTDIDATETALPILSGVDIDTLLIKLAPQIQTRKIILVGYSQGGMYANRIYDYLIHHGEPKEDIRIYGIATPETIQPDTGTYLNYQADTVIYASWAQQGGIVPPPFNVSVVDWNRDPNAKGNNLGHGFIDTYLDNFADRIVPEIQAQMFTLKATNPTDAGTCFEAPKDTIGHKAGEVALAAAGPTLEVMNAGALAAWNLTVGSVGVAVNTANAIEAFFHPSSNKTVDNSQGASDATIGLLHASNLTTLTPKVNEELRKPGVEDLGAAAVLAVLPGKKATTTATTTSQGEVLGAATDTLPVGTSTPLVASTTSELSVPIPQPNPAAGLVSHSDGQGASPSAAPVDNTVATSTATTTPAFGAPQNIVISNWRSGSGLCDLTSRIVDIAWDPVVGATQYELWQSQPRGGYQWLGNTASHSVAGITLDFGIGWSHQTTLKVVAVDGTGDYATTSLSAYDAAPDKVGPTIASIVPPLGSTGVPINAPLQIVYSEVLDSGTINTGTIGLIHRFSPASLGGGQQVDVSVTLEADGRTVDVVPAAPLLAGEGYDFSASCQVKDLYGNPAANLGGFLGSNDTHFVTAATP